jgi:ferredoxin
MAEYKVDQNTCIGCGICPSVAPDNFVLDGATAHVKKQPEKDDEKNKCKEALESCPVSAITFE